MSDHGGKRRKLSGHERRKLSEAKKRQDQAKTSRSIDQFFLGREGSSLSVRFNQSSSSLSEQCATSSGSGLLPGPTLPERETDRGSKQFIATNNDEDNLFSISAVPYTAEDSIGIGCEAVNNTHHPLTAVAVDDGDGTESTPAPESIQCLEVPITLSPSPEIKDSGKAKDKTETVENIMSHPEDQSSSDQDESDDAAADGDHHQTKKECVNSPGEGRACKPPSVSPHDPSIPVPKNEAERLERIKAGPYQPELSKYPSTVFGKKPRRFSAFWYQEFSWLEYSPANDSAFCFPCRIFQKAISSGQGHGDQVFLTVGYRNWKRGVKGLKSHADSITHKFNVEALDGYLKSTGIDQMLDAQRSAVIAQREIQRLKNRELLKRHIEVVRMLSIGGRPFRGDHEGPQDVVRGLFVDTLNLIAKFDPILDEHLKAGPKNAQYTSPQIQNEIIEAFHNVALQRLKEKCQGKKVAILADETSDTAHHEQLAIVVRIFNDDENAPEEHFVGLKRLKKTDAQSIFDAVDAGVEELGISWSNVVAVCFDGASSMSGHLSGVQAKCKQKNSKIVFVHCFSHCLNLMLTKTCGKDPKQRENATVVSFFGTLQLLFKFIEHSPKRHAIFEKLMKDAELSKLALKNLSLTRFAFQTLAVRAVKGARLAVILEAIKQIVNEASDAEVKAKGTGLLVQIKSFKFILCLHFMEPILEHIWKVTKTLQSPKINLVSALDDIHTLRKILVSLKSQEQFSEYFQEAMKTCEEMGINVPAVRNRRVSSRADPNPSTQYFFATKEEEMRVSAYFPLLDQMIMILDEKFNQETVDLISAVQSLTSLKPSTDHLHILAKRFNLQTSELKAEIKFLELKIEEHPLSNSGSGSIDPHCWLEWIKEHSKKASVCCFYTVLREFCIIPVTSCTCERCFSKMAIVKNKLRSTMTQDRLSHLLLLFVEQDITKCISADEVIEEFKVLVPFDRRLML